MLAHHRAAQLACTASIWHAWSRYGDQGGGKRKGAVAIYLEPWHSDIFEWLDLRKNHGKEEVGPAQLTVACYHASLLSSAEAACP